MHGGHRDVLGTGSAGSECWGTQGTVPHRDQGAPGIKVSLDQGALGCPWGPRALRYPWGPGALSYLGYQGALGCSWGSGCPWDASGDQVS